MVFKRKRQAKHYLDRYLDYNKTGMILRVETFSRGKTARVVSSTFEDVDLDRFYSDMSSAYTYYPPPGTLCYDQVKVLN